MMGQITEPQYRVDWQVRADRKGEWPAYLQLDLFTGACFITTRVPETGYAKHVAEHMLKSVQNFSGLEFSLVRDN